MRKLRLIEELALCQYLVNGGSEISSSVSFQSPHYPSDIQMAPTYRPIQLLLTHTTPQPFRVACPSYHGLLLVSHHPKHWVHIRCAHFFALCFSPFLNLSNVAFTLLMPLKRPLLKVSSLPAGKIFRRFTSFCPVVSDTITSVFWPLFFCKTTLF